MFRKAKNIDTAFRQVRQLSLFFIAGCILISFFALYSSQAIFTRSQQRIYVLAEGKALEAYGAERKDNIPVEATDHIKTFHEYFFSLDPDEKVINSNIRRALYLADGSAKKQYDNLREGGYYSSMIAGNISQQISIDSIEVKTDSYPYYFRCMAREKLTRVTSTVTRSLVTEGYLRSVSRSDNNPHGFLIERWMILENKDIKTELR